MIVDKHLRFRTATRTVAGEGNVLARSKLLGKSRPRRAGKSKPIRSLHFRYTLQAFGGLTVLVAVAFGIVHVRQVQSVEAGMVAQARSTARSLLAPAIDLLSRPEPMSIEQTMLNQSIRSVLKANPACATARVIDASGRVWASNRFEEIFTDHHVPLVAGGASGAVAAKVVSKDGLRLVLEPVIDSAATETGAPARLLGWIELGLSERAIGDRVIQERGELATIALFTLLLVLVIANVFIKIFRVRF